MSTFKESVYKVAKTDGYGIRAEKDSDDRSWYWGSVRTPMGYVSVYGEDGHLSLSLIHDGYEVTRIYKQTVSKRGIVTLARRFIEEMQP